MSQPSYRVTVFPNADLETSQTFLTLGAEICRDGILHLPMTLFAKGLRPEEWHTVTITKVLD